MLHGGSRSQNGGVKRVVNFDVLRQLLGDDAVEDAPEAYEFNWVGKQAARAEVLRPINKTLRPVKEDSVDWDTTQNLYIEGDNLEVLKLLQKSYLGKVKMIYIDPPYNTGNDFVYHDDFARSQKEENLAAGNVDELGNRFIKNTDSNGRYHSDWCSMIYSRLMIASTLLSEDGVIFMSIDEHELHNLMKIADEVFGIKNFITCVTRSTGTPTGGGFEGFVNELDYMLIYSKNKDKAKTYELEMTEDDAAIYDKVDERGRYLTRSLRRTGGEDRREDRPTMYFPITAPDGTSVYPLGPTGYESRWICSPATVEKMIAEDMLEWKQTMKNGEKVWTVYQKFYLENRTKAPGNLWTDIEGNKKATRDIRNLFDGKKVFDFPKPVGFLKKVLNIGMSKADLILDFFSGSSSTAQAVMQLNAEDNGTRHFIMVQLSEETPEDSEARKAGYTTIPEIAKERIRRAGKKIKEENPLTTQDLDTGFRVFRMDSSNYEEVEHAPKDWNQQELDLFLNNIKSDRTDLDLLFGCMLDWGVQLSLPMTTEEVEGKKIYTINEGDLVACFADKVTDNVVRAMAEK